MNWRIALVAVTGIIGGVLMFWPVGVRPPITPTPVAVAPTAPPPETQTQNVTLPPEPTSPPPAQREGAPDTPVLPVAETTLTAAPPATPATPANGVIVGVVSSSIYNAPLPGARVSAGGQSTVTDGAGRFRLAGLAPGGQPLTVSASGHEAKMITVPDVPESSPGPEVNVTLVPMPIGQESQASAIGAIIAPHIDGARVVQVKPGSSAEDAGLAEQDVITAIDGESIANKPVSETLEMLRLMEKPAVEVTVSRARGTTMRTTITRAQ